MLRSMGFLRAKDLGVAKEVDRVEEEEAVREGIDLDEALGRGREKDGPDMTEGVLGRMGNAENVRMR